MLVRDEADRYLFPALQHLCSFVDEIRVLDDGSTDGWFDRLPAPVDADRVKVTRTDAPSFFEHEGKTRSALLRWAYAADPTHVLVVDADEFVTDGARLRRILERGGHAWTLTMREVWAAGDGCLCVRHDGGWAPREVAAAFAAPRQTDTLDNGWLAADRKLAPGREPVAVRNLQRRRRAVPSGVAILHFGWACQADRHARHARYMEHDQGRYHSRVHLQSIMYPDRRVTMWAEEWPPALEPVREAVLARANRQQVTVT
jgi:hypothetical protein